MKRIQLLMLAGCIVLLFSGCGTNLETEMENTAKGVLTTVINQDIEAFNSYFPTEDDMQAIVAMADDTEESKAVARKDIDGMLLSMPREVTRSFAKMIRRADRYGLDGNDLSDYQLGYRLHSDKNVMRADIYLVFKSNGAHFRLKLDDCFWTGSRWVMTDRPSLKDHDPED